MPVFPGVLMCKLIHLRTQVRTVSVRICVYSYATSSSETDSCVQTGTSVDFVYMTEYAGALRVAHDHRTVSFNRQ